MEVADQFFTFRIEQVAAFAQQPVIGDDAVAYLAEFGIRESDLVEIGMVVLGRDQKVAQSADRLAETVGQVQQRDQRDKEKQQHEIKKEIVRFQAQFRRVVVRQRHPDEIVAEQPRIVIISFSGGYRVPNVASAAADQRLGDFGPRQVVLDDRFSVGARCRTARCRAGR